MSTPAHVNAILHQGCSQQAGLHPITLPKVGPNKSAGESPLHRHRIAIYCQTITRLQFTAIVLNRTIQKQCNIACLRQHITELLAVFGLAVFGVQLAYVPRKSMSTILPEGDGGRCNKPQLGGSSTRLPCGGEEGLPTGRESTGQGHLVGRITQAEAMDGRHTCRAGLGFGQDTCSLGSVRPLPMARPVSLKRGGPICNIWLGTSRVTKSPGWEGLGLCTCSS